MTTNNNARKPVIDTLMESDGLTRSEAIAIKREIVARLWEAMEDGEDPHDVIQDEYGMEPDYLDDLIF